MKTTLGCLCLVEEVLTWREVGRSLRAAMKGWGPTLRLITILVAACALVMASRLVT
jgi:hypothetical protein